MVQNFGADSDYVHYLKYFQGLHFHVCGSEGYEGACFLPGKFHETEYDITEDTYTIRHSVTNGRMAIFSIVKPAQKRSLEEIQEAYREEFGPSIAYAPIP